jgi:two-component sensor histidine kinase
LFYFKKSLRFAKKINHVYFIANGCHNVGSVYIKQEQFKIGGTYLQQAVTLYEEQDNLLGYAMTISLLAQVDFAQKKYQSALSKYQRVNKIALEHHYLSLQKESSEQLSKIYEEQKRFELALMHNQKVKVITDSLNNTERLKTINKLENQYLNAQTNRIILEQKVGIQRERNRGLLLSLISIIIIAISFFVIWKRKAENKLLSEKNELIESQQLELKHRTENQLEQLSDLFAIYGLMNTGNTEVLKEAQSRVEAINLVYRYLENNKGNDIDIKPFIVKLVNNILIIYGIQKDEIDVKIDIVNTKVGVNKTQIIGQIINEILNNTFKHAFGTRTEKREIFVSLSQTDSIFELRVVDNGQGFDSNKLKTDRMGLSLIAAFVKSLRGEMITETGDNGTKYRIKFTQVS